MRWLKWRIFRIQYCTLGRLCTQSLFPRASRWAWARVREYGWVDD